ncbi:MAG: GLUG motif-containing protein [candidate division Zixibacteria bacterium]|nr:GLUG motif-containing protein [candidate division Zixibacteria bacterium]
MKKLISLILMLTVSVVFAGTYSGGSGSSADPYQIANFDDLVELSDSTNDWDSCFIQTANIDASDSDTMNVLGSDTLGFSPIGNGTTNFTGEYDGQGHTIDSLYINRSTTDLIGLFGFTNDSVIDSLGVTNVDITGNEFVGGFVGVNYISTITNSYSTGIVSGSGECVGGLVGNNENSSTISNSYSTGSVSGDNAIGGFVGRNDQSSTITNSYSTGSVSGADEVGGLVGDNHLSTVTNSFWDTQTSGQPSSDGGAGRTTAEMTDLDLSSNLFYASFWDFVDSTENGTDDYWNQGNAKNDNYPYLAWQYPSDALGLSGSYTFPTSTPPSGSGTVVNPYQIETMANLYWLSKTDSVWSNYFIQTEDIDVDYENMKKWEGGQGFSPIGNDGTKFTGKYNGQGYTIDSLFIDRSGEDYIGLFGYTNGSAIDSLGLTSVDITGNTHTGGIVGKNDTSSIVSNSYSIGSVSGSYNVGGLLGSNNYSSTISNSYSTGSVSGSSSVGGLVGYNNYYSTVSNSYSTGSGSGGSGSVGGLVGNNNYYSKISNSYSTGSVSGSYNVGGLVGGNNISTASNSFWDTQTSGQSSSDGGTGKTTTEMQDVATFTDVSTAGLDEAWDFVDNPNDDSNNNDIWKMDGYPVFNYQGSDNVIELNVKIYLEGAYK